MRPADAVPDDTVLDDTLLDDDERARAARMAGDEQRREFTTAHVLLRRALSSVAPAVEPRGWRVRKTPDGRPEGDGRDGPRFNISHPRGLVACVVTSVDCGIDVERVIRTRELPRRRVLSDGEAAAVDGADDPALAYTRHWALKEAYAKARGLGLALPFARLLVTLGE